MTGSTPEATAGSWSPWLSDGVTDAGESAGCYQEGMIASG